MLLRPLGYAQCECLWEVSFSDVQADTDLVVSGTVAAAKGNSIDLKVNRCLCGEEAPEGIQILLKSDDYCRPEVGLLPIGTQWVMAVNEITEVTPAGFNPSTPNISYGHIGDYSETSCRGYWLRQTNNLDNR